MSSTGFVWHERYLWHDSRSGAGPLPSWASPWIEPEPNAESPASKRRLLNLLAVSGLLDRLVPLAPRSATVDEVCRYHTRSYVDRIATLSSDTGGDGGTIAPFGAFSYEIALLSAGGVITAVDAVLDGTVRNAYALVRPPGHHALPDEGMGFCIFGNIAIATHHARQARGLHRVAVVDWDVHHGNGTQTAFYGDPSVLTISLHQDGVFPLDQGTIAENGTGPGAGYNINVPLPAGSGPGAYRAALDRVVLPALRRFGPELVIVACGYDASTFDPLARQMLHSDSFRELTAAMVAVADELCGGRLVMVHEGGYATFYVPFCGLAVVETLCGIRTEVTDPFLELASGIPGQDLQPHQIPPIEAAAELARKVPSP